MAEITLEPLSLVGSGFLNGKTSKITKNNSSLFSAGTTNVTPILIVKSKSTISGSSSVPFTKGNLIKYVSSNSDSLATSIASSKKYKTVRVALVTDSILEAFTIDRDIQESFKNYLPKLYEEFEDITKMMQVEANEITRFLAIVNSVIDQAFPSTATYALELWERELGISTISQRSEASRRHYINAKLKGVGTVTKGLLNDIVNSFYFSEVTEVPSEIKTKIKLLGKRGIPRNLEDIEVAVSDVIPAHVDHEYEFTYLTWGEVEEAGLTWEQANEYTHEQIVKTFLIDPGYPYEN